MTSSHDVQDIEGGQARVLVGVDGSEDGLRAVRFGARTVLARGGVLHLVHVVDDAAEGSWGLAYNEAALQAADQTVEEAVAIAQGEGLAREQVRDEVVMGSVASVLIQKSREAALLVVGRRGVSGLRWMFVGSTGVAVVDAAHCPVVVVSAASAPEVTGGRRSIGVGIGTRDHSESTLEFAAAEAERRGAALHVIHVAHPGRAKETEGGSAGAGHMAVDELLAAVRERHPSVTADMEITTGHPVEALVNRSAELDLLVVGVTKSKFVGVHLGGAMRGLLAHSQCPVLLVK